MLGTEQQLASISARLEDAGPSPTCKHPPSSQPGQHLPCLPSFLPALSQSQSLAVAAQALRRCKRTAFLAKE